jgi:integrase
MKKEYLRGRLIQLENLKRSTLTEFREDYTDSRADVSIWTIKKDKLSLKLLADVIGGSTQVRAITKNKVEEFKAACLKRAASKITINGYLRHLKTAFKWGREEGYLIKLPEIVMYKRLRRPEEERLSRILSPDEIKAVLKNTSEFDPTFGVYCLVVLWTGGRRREGLTLEWQKVDFKNDRITLRGKTGQRTIPMLEPVKKALEPIQKDIGKVFPSWHPDTVSHWFKKILILSGIPNHRLHDLRHTCATYLLKNGVSLEVVQRIMGHAQITTTQIYAKVLDEILQKEMRKLKFE